MCRRPPAVTIARQKGAAGGRALRRPTGMVDVGDAPDSTGFEEEEEEQEEQAAFEEEDAPEGRSIFWYHVVDEELAGVRAHHPGLGGRHERASD